MHIPADTSILVADYGVGDHYLVAAFAEAICQRYGVRVCMAGRGDMSFLASLFPRVDRYLLWREDLSRDLLKEKAIKGGVMFNAHFPGLELMRAVGYRDFHFLDAYRCRFGLAANADLSRPRLPLPAELAEARNILDASGIRSGNFVFLCADTRSTPTDGITLNFWQALAENLHARGFTPVFNVRPDTAVPEPAIGVTLPLHLLRSLVMLSAGVCTARSGLSELFCDLPRPRAVVYADVQYWAGALRTGTTFENYGLEWPPLEWTVTPEGANQAAQEIAGSFSDAGVTGGVSAPTIEAAGAAGGR